jgi:CheY-like chemotaxis protein
LLRLLLVENHRVFAETVAKTFLADHDVALAATVAYAVNLLRVSRFDAALVDYDLDDGKGDAVVQAAVAAGVPAVACSAHSLGNTLLTQSGATAACPKTEFSRIEAVLHDLFPNGARGGELCDHCRDRVPALVADEKVLDRARTLSWGQPTLARAELIAATGCSEEAATLWVTHRGRALPVRPGPPCPSCRCDLPTTRAKQCIHCGAEWHVRRDVSKR